MPRAKVPAKRLGKIATMTAAGKTNAQIAEKLGLSVTTVHRDRQREETKALIAQAGHLMAQQGLATAMDNVLSLSHQAHLDIDEAAKVREAGRLEHDRLMAAGDPKAAKDALKSASAEARAILDAAKAHLTLSEKSNARWMTAVGLLPSNMPSPVYNQMYVDMRGAVIHQDVLKALTGGLSDGLGGLLGAAPQDGGDGELDVVDILDADDGADE